LTKGYIYFVGSTNSGKTSLISALRNTANKFNPKTYKDPFDLQMVPKNYKTEIQKNENVNKHRGESTISFLPGTTLKPIEIDDFKLGAKVFDTPGIPSINKVSDYIHNVRELKHVL
jgi:ribosome biogenesis GTPase A